MEKEYEFITEGYVSVSADSEEDAKAIAEQKVADISNSHAMTDFYLQLGGEVTCLTEMDEDAKGESDE